jgi:cellulose synthase/poly-beta-1,6-N-acetylglucosamine synthase-like glycosyltransferase
VIGFVLALCAGAVVLLPCAILGALAIVSLRRDMRRSSRPRATRPVLSALVAAHDEEPGIGATLAAIAAVDPAIRIHVMADNCSDRTAEIATRAGACVHERDDPLLPGKPAALNRLIAEVLEEDPRAHAFAFLDADARPEPGFFDALRGPISRGARAVQAKNLVAVSDAPLSRLRAIAFHLKCDLRPRAYDALRLSVGLHGNGMCLTRDVLRRYAWNERSVVEDGELHLRLVRDGIRVELAPAAVVRSPMPTTFGEASGQAVRWERGKVDLFDDATRLLRAGIRKRSPIAVAAAVDTLIPPLSFLIAAGGALSVTALVAGSAPLLAVGAASLLSIALYVARGIALARLDMRALASAGAWAGPYVLWKVLVLARTLLGAGRGQWSQARTQVREVV